ncbi:MAG: response regulator [Butyricicoccus sp.]
MMRVFIADDEEIIRDGIRNCIEKEQERFLFAGEAPDGEMALPMLMEMKPDVLITDIRMPFMDGLELAKVVRRTMPWLRIVFLSGHDEFEYAQKAVSLHADAYLLKPVSSAQLLETLGQVAEQIEQEQQQLRSEGANIRSEHDEDELREHFLNDLLRAACRLRRRLYRRTLGLLLTAKQYLVCIVRLPENAVQEQVRHRPSVCAVRKARSAPFFAAAAGWCSCCARDRGSCAKPPRVLSEPAARALSGAGLERAVRDRRTGLPCQRPAGKLLHSEGYTAAGLRMCGGRRIRQHGLCRCAARVRFLGGRLAGGQAAACRPRGRAAYCRGLLRWLCGAGRAERAVPVLSADEPARHGLSAG